MWRGTEINMNRDRAAIQYRSRGAAILLVLCQLAHLWQLEL